MYVMVIIRGQLSLPQVRLQLLPLQRLLQLQLHHLNYFSVPKDTIKGLKLQSIYSDLWFIQSKKKDEVNKMRYIGTRILDASSRNNPAFL